MPKKKISDLAIQLLGFVREQTGCGIQYGDCPCNTCFHAWACAEIGDFYGHLFWLLLLGIRGDSEDEEGRLSIISALEKHLAEYKHLSTPPTKKTNKKK